MLSELAYYSILGKPLVLFLGILTFLSFSFTATLGYFFYTGRPLLPFKWHPIAAVTSLTLGLIHGVLAASVYFK